MSLEYKINKRGYHLYNTYTGIFGQIMFNPRYQYVNNRLLKRYVAYIYTKLVTGKFGGQ